METETVVGKSVQNVRTDAQKANVGNATGSDKNLILVIKLFKELVNGGEPLIHCNELFLARTTRRGEG